MARDQIKVQLPMPIERTNSIEMVSFEKAEVVAGNGIEIVRALDNKDNSLVLIVEPTAAAEITIKAGGEYPNSMLGDLVVSPVEDEVNAILLEDISRFERRDGSVMIDFADSFEGTIYAVAKRAGLKTDY